MAVQARSWQTRRRSLAVRVAVLMMLVAGVMAIPDAGTAVSTDAASGSGDSSPPTTTPTPTPTTPTPTTQTPTPTTPTPTTPVPTTTSPSSGDGSKNPEITNPTPIATTTTPTPTTAGPTATPSPTATTVTPKPSTTKKSSSGSGSVGGLNIGSSSGSGTNKTTEAPSSNSHTNVIIIAVGVVAVVIIIAIAFIACRRRSKKEDQDKALRRQLDQLDMELGESAYAMVAGSGTGGSSGSGGRRSSAMRGRSSLQFKNSLSKSPASWGSSRTTGTGSESDTMNPIWKNEAIQSARIPFEKIRFRDVISRGGFGEVLEGVYHQQRVAIKRLLPEHRRRMASLEDFLKEALLLSSLDHERVITFIGVAWDSPRDLCLVLEFMANGDLRNMLTEWKEEGRKTGWADVRKVRIALHVAEALTYLHTLSPKIVHRDLKSKNVLLNEHWEAKISDFGVSREESTHNTMTTNVGSSLWIAPEVMVGNNYDERADIFSFGIVLTELDSMQLPYHSVRTPDGRKLPDAAVLHMVTMGKVQAEFSSMSRTDMVLLGRSCLAVNPQQRPSAAEVRYRLTQILSTF